MRAVKLDILSFKWILILMLVNAWNIAIAQVIKTTGTPLSSVTLIYGTPSTSLTATTKFTVEGTSLTNDIVVTPPPEFEVSRDNITYTNTLTIPVGTGNISPTEIYIRLKSTTNVGSYTDDIILSSGSTSVNVNIPASTVTPAPISISVFAEINYGDVLNDMTLTSPGFDFSKINLGLKNGEIATSLHVSLIGGHTGKENVGFYDKVIVSSDLRVNGFLPTNYDITYTPGPITIFPAPLVITANDITKPYGNTLTGGEIASTAFTHTGLQNGESINSVTITYGDGAQASAPVGRYNDVVVPSGAAGANGFLPTNYNITYQTAITVTPIPLTATAENKSKLYNDPNPPLTITYTCFVNGEDAAQLTTQPIAATTAMQGSDVGLYPITVSGGSSSNYTLNYVDGTLTIYKDISIPNTFTPNGDGINDNWSISNLKPNLSITVEIMNRYGARVYYSSGNSVSWDGYSNGVPVPFGVYYYVIKGVKEKPLSGYITVVR